MLLYHVYNGDHGEDLHSGASSGALDSDFVQSLPDAEAGPAGLVERVDLYRLAAVRSLDQARRAEMGQFPTSPAIARFMASLFTELPSDVALLDAGAGVGTLTAAFAEEMCHRAVRPRRITATAYEIDPLLSEYLHLTMRGCEELCQQHSIEFSGQAICEDFVVTGVAQLRGDLFAPQTSRYTAAILNPPYRKIRSDSQYRALLREIGVETSNLYAGFLAIVIGLLESGGQLVAITPRSFCNGPYFRPFRQLLLGNMALKHIHVFEARDEAFGADEVLQENIIFHAVKHGVRDRVVISHTHAVGDDTMAAREMPYDQVVSQDDPDLVIHIAANEMDMLVKDRITLFQYALDDIGISVSTGRVVDFRVSDMLRGSGGPDTVPLIHPGHFVRGQVRWPNPKVRKPEAIVRSEVTASLLLPAACYVLVKRFSSKEEPRRVVAAVLEPEHISAPVFGFENHLNYFHVNNTGLPPDLARGLALYLNSTLVDVYFRQFSGHTQVNAADLRMLRYPSREFLARLGARSWESLPTQQEIDTLLEEEMRCMVDIQSPDPIAAKSRF